MRALLLGKRKEGGKKGGKKEEKGGKGMGKDLPDQLLPRSLYKRKENDVWATVKTKIHVTVH